MNKQVVYYVGARKTASSMNRIFLNHRSDELLARHRVRCVDRIEIMESPFFRPVEQLGKGRLPTDAERQAGLEQAQRWIDTEGADNILLHNENFFTALFFSHASSVAAYLKEAALGHRARVILYVRRQPDYFESWYLQHVHVGQRLSFEDYWEKFRDTDLSWLRVAHALEAAFGKEQVHVVPYESIREGGRAYLQRFLELAVGPGVDIGDYKTERVNRSFSDLALRLALDYFPEMTEQERRKTRLFLQKNFSTATHARPILMTDAQRTTMFERYAEDNARLFDAFVSGHDAGDLGYV